MSRMASFLGEIAIPQANDDIPFVMPIQEQNQAPKISFACFFHPVDQGTESLPETMLVLTLASVP